MSESHADQEGITATPPSHDHDIAGGYPPHQLPFTEEEWKSLQASDLAAARAVVTLLLGVFFIGIVLYSIVCIVVS
jgi:hypothetical protein